MSASELAITVRCRIDWHRWLGWFFLCPLLCGMARTGLRSREDCYSIGKRYLYDSLSIQCGNGRWQKPEWRVRH